MGRRARTIASLVAASVPLLAIGAGDSAAQRRTDRYDGGTRSDASTTDVTVEAGLDASVSMVTMSCSVAGEACTSGASCCSGLCAANASAGALRCQHLSGCAPAGEACTTGSMCCSGTCGAVSASGERRCERTSSCNVAGDLFGNGNCCVLQRLGRTTTRSGVDRCNDKSVCLAIGSSCAFDEQCCNAGHCLLGLYGFRCSDRCIPAGEGTCVASTDCCSGSCGRSGICN